MSLKLTSVGLSRPHKAKARVARPKPKPSRPIKAKDMTSKPRPNIPATKARGTLITVF